MFVELGISPNRSTVSYRGQSRGQEKQWQLIGLAIRCAGLHKRIERCRVSVETCVPVSITCNCGAMLGATGPARVTPVSTGVHKRRQQCARIGRVT